jgi:hypothetical protein
MKTLNQKHHKILKEFTKDVDRFIYDVTEDQTINTFMNFIPLKRKAEMIHNKLGEDIENNEISKTEWVFMLPNFLMFGAVGFASALKTEENTIEIEDKIHDLFSEMTLTIGDLDEMLSEHLLTIEAMDIIDDIAGIKQTTTKTNKQ